MKIALLNLPVDNNYGGNLQRYALMKVLQDMGHDVTHIYLKYRRELPMYKKPYSYTKRFVLKYFFNKNIHINQEGYFNRLEDLKIQKILPFYNKYIKHTECCYSIRDVRRKTKGKFDAYIVGSDQVWRKSMCIPIGWRNFLLDFTKGEDVKRIAYAVSFGTDSSEYNEDDYDSFQKLFSTFDIVSVREKSAIKILNSIGCNTEYVVTCLDPTLLIEKSEWKKLFYSTKLEEPTKGKIFCYVLDMTKEIEKIINEKAKELKCPVVIAGLSNTTLSITEWLMSIYDADYVITDSYHGTVFSIIFKKRFIYCGNMRRGNSRVESLFEILGFNTEIEKNTNSEIVKNNIIQYKKTSVNIFKNL